ncbi:MAG: hypothetical protein SWY16_08920 [Cyanobacteriota bacterium]|nr:hypothetical protein [Cyanobacteriota bacterium]
MLVLSLSFSNSSSPLPRLISTSPPHLLLKFPITASPRLRVSASFLPHPLQYLYTILVSTVLDSLLPQFSMTPQTLQFVMTCLAVSIFGVPFGRFLNNLITWLTQNSPTRPKRLSMWMAIILIVGAVFLPDFWGGILVALASGMLLGYVFTEQFREDWQSRTEEESGE